MYQSLAPDELSEHRDAVIKFNRMMDEEAAVHHLNETVLVQLLNRLDENVLVYDAFYCFPWLALMSLQSCVQQTTQRVSSSPGGGSACESSAGSGSCGRGGPAYHQRTAHTSHGQFCHKAPSKGEVIRWLTSHTIVEKRTDALLPDLLGCLKASGFFPMPL